MKIAFLITSLGGGGAERVVCNLAGYLVEKGHSVSITTIRGSDTKYDLDSRVEINDLQKDYYESKVSLYTRFKEIAKIIKFFISIKRDQNLVCFLELPVAYALIFKPIIKAKIIICERNNPECYTKGYQRIYKKFANRADLSTCQTAEIASWYKKYIKDERKICIIPNSINSEIIKAHQSNKSSKTIVTIARLVPQKNLKLLIDAFEIISVDFPDYRLEIYGEGPLKEDLQLLVKAKHIEDKVFFPGFTKDIIGVLQTASMFVLTSDHEGMPNALAEALAMGVPCIATDCGGGGARELISTGQNGILINRGDLSALVFAMKKILSDRDFANKISSESLLLRDILDPNLIHAKWENILGLVENNDLSKY